jgi:hypothetical protein
LFKRESSNWGPIGEGLWTFYLLQTI